MIKHDGQDDLAKEGLVLDLMVTAGEASITTRVEKMGKYGGKHQTWQQQEQLKAHISTRKQEATTDNSEIAQV